VLGGVDLNGPHLFTVRRAARRARGRAPDLRRGAPWRGEAAPAAAAAPLALCSRAAESSKTQIFQPCKRPPIAALAPRPAPAAAPQIFPHGSTDALPFATMGSGSLNAMAVFEAGFKEDMTKEEAMALVAAAIRRRGAWGNGERAGWGGGGPRQCVLGTC
jgi:hypothetical protein